MKTNAFIGQKYGFLTILDILPTIKIEANKGRAYNYYAVVKCQCKCGDIVLRKKKGLQQGNMNHCDNKSCIREYRRAKSKSDKNYFI